MPGMNQRIVFLASFLTIFAAGVGFGVRTDILGDWASQFGFTKTELGEITGQGLVGFGVIIILCSLFIDRVGYKPILILAFVTHFVSAVITLAATPIFHASGKNAAYWCLSIGMFLFSVGNGLCEAVVNPLVATLYPNKKTHYLNILHASWPAGLVVGALIAYGFVGGDAAISPLRWEVSWSLFLLPVLLYGLMVMPQKLPVSEARAAGVSFGQMLAQFASPILITLLMLHAMVGYVELGTDSWITNIMNNVIGDKALLLFIYTSTLMFVLRFFAGPIVEHINPLGLLFVSAVLGATGLVLLGSVTTGVLIVAAGTVYGCGKTFLWPTMLGVVGERFPKGGALVMGTMGGVGMLSAGLLGGPGIGYKQDYFASQNLQQVSAETYSRYQSPSKNSFLFFPAIQGLDGAKVATLNEGGSSIKRDFEIATKENKVTPDLTAMHQWWTTVGAPHAEKDKPVVTQATDHGGRMALKVTAAIPATMALGYLLLILYFKARGGYRQVEIDSRGHEHEGRKPTAKQAVYADSRADQA